MKKANKHTYICKFVVYYRKYKDEKARIEVEKTKFEQTWVSNPVTFNKLVAFLAHLGQVDEMAKWVRNAICTHQGRSLDNIVDPNLVYLSIPPSLITLRYGKLKAFRNHFQVDSDQNNLLVTYGCGVAFVFEQFARSEDDVLGAIQYVGTLKEILQLDYGLVFSPIILFQCQWVKNGIDNRRNPIYK